MSHIFISYSHKDKTYAQELAKKAKQLAVPIWIDNKLETGEQWQRVIEEKINTCAGFIVIMTPSSYKSTWVQKELNHAQSKNKQIYPLLLSGEDTWLSVRDIQHLDVRNKQLPQAKFFTKLFLSLYPPELFNIEHREEIDSNFIRALPSDWHYFPRIREAHELIALISQTDIYQPHYADPLNKTEAKLVDAFLKEILNICNDVVHAILPSAETVLLLRKHIKALENKGLCVYAAINKATVKDVSQKVVNSLFVEIRREDEDYVLIIFKS